MFAPTLEDTRKTREDARRRWSFLDRVDVSTVPLSELQSAWATINAYAEELSGTTRDAARRAIAYYAIYEDSGGNFMFPLVATHGSLWGVTHTLRVERILGRFRGLSPETIDRWLTALDKVRDINRRVFVEVYTTFYFTRYFGRHPAAGDIIRPAVLAIYNRVHRAIREGVPLNREERRALYYEVFVHEQEDIVHPGILDAVAVADQPFVTMLLKHVSPRFRYFPRQERLFFTDFTDVNQRNREGLRALDFAEEVGPKRVLAAMSEYGISA